MDIPEKESRRLTMEVKASPLNILFVQNFPCIRNYKMASALRSRDHSVSLAYSEKPLSQMYTGLSDSTYNACIRINNYRHLWEISKSYDFIHCHNEPDILSVAAFAGSAPVIHDTHDLISLRDQSDPNLSFFEGLANRGAAGRVYSTLYQLEEAKKLYGVNGPSLVFNNYVSGSDLPETLLPKLSRNNCEVHIVYEGGIGGSGHRNFADLFIELANNNIHVHIFPANFSKEQAEFFSKYSRILYHAPVSPKKLIETMSQFDFGIIPFKIENGNKRFLDSTIANKLFEYLAAGLPVITSPLKSYIDFFSKNPVGLVFNNVDDILRNIPRLNEIAKNTDFSKQVFTYEKEIEKLEIFYRRLQKNQQALFSVRNSVIPTKQNCPICQNNDTEISADMEPHTLIYCANCQTYFVDPMPTDGFLRDWYSEKEKKKRWDNDLSLAIQTNHCQNADLYEKYFDIFSKKIHLNKHAKILEIGCYDGLFLKRFSDAGYECKGIDLNEGFVKYGRSHYGLDLASGTIFDFQFSDNSFDLVIFHQVLEHLNNPIKFLKEVNRICKDNGTLFLSVPNTGSFIHKAEASVKDGNCQPSFIDFPNHLFYYSKKSITIMLNDAGFRNSYLRTYSNPANTKNSLKKHSADDASLIESRKNLVANHPVCEWRKIKSHISKIALRAIHQEAEFLGNVLDDALGLLVVAKKKSSKTHHCEPTNKRFTSVSSKPFVSSGKIPRGLILKGTSYRPLLDLEKTQWLPVDRLREIQNVFLRMLIKEAYQKVPFYRKILDEAGIRPEHVYSIADLKQIPIMDKDILQANYDDILNSDLDKLEKHYTATGGSTGKTLKYVVSPEVYYYGFGCRNRGFRWAGFDDAQDKVAYFAGGSLGVTDTVETDGNKLKIPVTGITSKSIMQKYYDALITFAPKYMRAYPSALYQFCVYLREENIPLKLKSIITTAENLFDYQRKMIEEVLSCEIFNEYGAYDGGAGAFECTKHSGLHLQMERGILEILDENGNEVKPGRVGRVIVTDLHNYLFPFIRYDVGDLVVATDRLCSCGRGLQLIQGIKGRSSDYIILGDGAKLSGEAIIHLFNKLLQEHRIDISQYQVNQKTDRSIRILIVPGHNYRNENINTMQQVFQTHLKGLQVHVEKVSEIIRTSAGKTRFVFTEIESAKISNPQIIVSKEKEKPKICHIGGAHSAHVADIVRELEERGYHQCVVSYFPEDKSITPSNIPVYYFPYKNYEHSNWKKQCLEALLKHFLGQIFEREKPDLIHGHSLTYACVPTWLAKKYFGIKTVLMPWSINTMVNPSPVANNYEKKCLSVLDKFLYPLPAGFKRFQEFYGEMNSNKLVHFKALVDLSQYNQNREVQSQPRILSARVMGDLYRQDLLIKALPRFVSEFPDTVVTLIIGQNPSQGLAYFEKMKDLAQKLKVDTYCNFIDRCLAKSEFADLINNHNIIYSLSTHDEGFSGTNLQSAYSGAVTIMQKSNWVKGILDDQQNVLQASADEQSISDVLMFAGTHLDELQNRFLNNNKKLKQYDKEVLMENLIYCYQELFENTMT